MRDESKGPYAVVRFNFLTYAAGGVMAIVKGHDNAQAIIRQFEAEQRAEDRQAGWRYFMEKTDLKPGMDPAQATNLRQMSLDLRESEA